MPSIDSLGQVIREESRFSGMCLEYALGRISISADSLFPLEVLDSFIRSKRYTQFGLIHQSQRPDAGKDILVVVKWGSIYAHIGYLRDDGIVEHKLGKTVYRSTVSQIIDYYSLDARSSVSLFYLYRPKVVRR